jgi:hypothetical protein
VKKLIYLANAYSSNLEDPDAAALQRSQRRQLESFVGGKLKKRYGVTVLLPIAISAAMAELCQFGTGFDEWKDDDLNFISRCDEVWVLTSDGWIESIGVQAEVKFALDNKIPIKYVNPITFDLNDEVIHWDMYI